MSIKRIITAGALLGSLALGGCVVYDPYAPYPVVGPAYYAPAPAYYPAPASYPAVGSVSLAFGSGWAGRHHHHHHHHHGRHRH